MINDSSIKGISPAPWTAEPVAGALGHYVIRDANGGVIIRVHADTRGQGSAESAEHGGAEVWHKRLESQGTANAALVGSAPETWRALCDLHTVEDGRGRKRR